MRACMRCYMFFTVRMATFVLVSTSGKNRPPIISLYSNCVLIPRSSSLIPMECIYTYIQIKYIMYRVLHNVPSFLRGRESLLYKQLDYRIHV